jgi:hypothetical protein
MRMKEVQMKTVLGLTVLGTMLAAAGGVMAVGWAYEGPRRFVRRLRLRKALR